MISDVALFHGAFFHGLVGHLKSPVGIERITEAGSGFYLIDGRIPVYLKHSTRRKGPWQFNFFRTHQETQQSLFDEHGVCITGLICARDGIAGLDMFELRHLLDENFEEQEVISIRRCLRGQYEIRGRDGALGARVSRSSIFDKIAHAVEKS